MVSLIANKRKTLIDDLFGQQNTKKQPYFLMTTSPLFLHYTALTLLRKSYIKTLKTYSQYVVLGALRLLILKRR